MFTALLVIIYVSFISLGLPDSLLGSAWPAIQKSLEAPLPFAGVISMIVSCGTVISSLMSTRVIRRFGTGRVTLVSVAMTAFALLGFSFAPQVGWLCLLAVPLGLGAGSVDAGLNNFVALHYQAKHMSWLHCFWGIGATAGPIVMAFWIDRNNNWHAGYRTIGLLQAALVAVLLFSLPLWKKVSSPQEEEGEEAVVALSLRQVFCLPKAKGALLGFFCYTAVEVTANLWTSSYAVKGFGVSEDTAAGWSSLFFLGITIGRLLSGFVAIKFSSPTLIRVGQGVGLCGILLLFLPLPQWRMPLGLCLIGGGCAPIFPAMLHQTPQVFGKEVLPGHDGGADGLFVCGRHGDPPAVWLFGRLFRCAHPADIPAAVPSPHVPGHGKHPPGQPAEWEAVIKSFGKEAALWHSIPSTGTPGTGQSALSIIFPRCPASTA